MLTSVRKTRQIHNLFNFANIWPPIICWFMSFLQVVNLFWQFCKSKKNYKESIVKFWVNWWNYGSVSNYFSCMKCYCGLNVFFVKMWFHKCKNAPSKNISTPPPMYSGDLKGAKLSIWHFYGPRLIYGRLRSTFMDLVVLYGLL